MEHPIDFKAVAAQLAKPDGENGLKTAEHMNLSNGDMTRRAIATLQCQAGQAVLEIGPGNGRFADHVLAQAPDIRYSGVDISETMVEAARQLHTEQIASGTVHFEHVDGVSLPFPDQHFDRIFTVNTLYFWNAPADQLAEVRRVLRPGGRFCLAIASKRFMETLPFTAYGFTLYTPDDACQLLTKQGFQLVSVDINEYPTISASKQEVMREEVFIVVE